MMSALTTRRRVSWVKPIRRRRPFSSPVSREESPLDWWAHQIARVSFGVMLMGAIGTVVAVVTP